MKCTRAIGCGGAIAECAHCVSPDQWRERPSQRQQYRKAVRYIIANARIKALKIIDCQSLQSKEKQEVNDKVGRRMCADVATNRPISFEKLGWCAAGSGRYGIMPVCQNVGAQVAIAVQLLPVHGGRQLQKQKKKKKGSERSKRR